MKRILCINPWIHDFTAFDLWLKPLGLLSIASLLRRKGYDVSLLDCMDGHDPSMPLPKKSSGSRLLHEFGCGYYWTEIISKPPISQTVPRYWKRFGLPYETVKSRLQKFPTPDGIFLTTVMTYWYPGAKEMLDLCRQIWPGIPVILGGIYGTICPEHARKQGFDQVVSGTDPIQVSRQLEAILGNTLEVKNLADYFSIYPSFDLYPEVPYAVILTSLGCPFRCSYCVSGSLYPHYFQREPRQVFSELRHDVEVLEVRDIAFYDDALLFQAERGFLPLLRLIREAAFPVRFHLPNSLHARYVTFEIAQLMKQCHFSTLRISLETVSQELQRMTGGKVGRKNFEQAIHNFLEAGFLPEEIEIYLLFGFPGARKEDYLESIDYVKNMGLKPRLSLYSPIPGTSDYQKLPWLDLTSDPLLHNKIVYLYHSGQNDLYEFLQKRGQG
ncbi:MAG: radical SAM protein [Atribacterota bacterium]